MKIDDEFLEVWVSSYALQFLPRYSLQYDPGVVRRFPQVRIETLPELIRRVIEGPSQVQR